MEILPCKNTPLYGIAIQVNNALLLLHGISNYFECAHRGLTKLQHCCFGHSLWIKNLQVWTPTKHGDLGPARP